MTCPDCEREVCAAGECDLADMLCHARMGGEHGREPMDWRSEAIALRERVASLETAVRVERGLRERAQAERDELRALIATEDVQWASCDGCGLRGYCSSCGAERRHWNEDGTELLENGKHTPECPIGRALAR